MEAEVIPPPLHVGGGKRNAERLAQDAQILEIDLLLQVLGSGGNEHALAAENGGDQVRQCLSGAGAGLDQQDASVLEGAGDSIGHLPLRRTALERRQCGSERPRIGEYACDALG
jgi:hypothetical protein